MAARNVVGGNEAAGNAVGNVAAGNVVVELYNEWSTRAHGSRLKAAELVVVGLQLYGATVLQQLFVVGS